jgi:hypothetical protein
MRARTLRRAAERKASKLAHQASVENDLARMASVQNESVRQASLENQPACQAPTPEPAAVEPVSLEATAACTTGPVEAPSPSPARLAANRANAQLSTGAKSPATKAICAQNHTTHGLARHSNGTFKLLSSEDPAGFEAFKQSLFDEHKTNTPTESILINNMVECQWLADRAQRLLDTCIDPDTGTVTNEKSFSLYLRYQTTHRRAFHRSLHDLQKLRAEKCKAQIGFEAQNVRNDQNARKNALHHVDVHMKETDLLLEIVKYTNQLMAARRENSNFAVEFAAELAKRGLPMGEREVIFTSTA